jgi:hypothetical protein
MLATLLENVDEKMLATLRKMLMKKWWHHFWKMLTRKNVDNTSDKCWQKM